MTRKPCMIKFAKESGTLGLYVDKNRDGNFAKVYEFSSYKHLYKYLAENIVNLNNNFVMVDMIRAEETLTGKAQFMRVPIILPYEKLGNSVVKSDKSPTITTAIPKIKMTMQKPRDGMIIFGQGEESDISYLNKLAL